MTSVLIVGAGPTGLTLGCDLARRGIAVRIIDKAPQFHPGSRAKGPNARSLEVLADLGVVDEVLALGVPPMPLRKYRDGRPVTDTDPYADADPTPSVPYGRRWHIPQWRVEEILRGKLAHYGVTVELGSELVELAQDETSVTATLADGSRIGAAYLVGCDGGRSRVRKLMGARFDGATDESTVLVCGDVEVDGLEPDYWHQWFDADGVVLLCPMPGTPAWQFQATPERDADGGLVPPSLESFQRLLDRHSRRTGIRLSNPTWLSTYRVNVRMADRYRTGRVLLAGDAAHVHPIAGGLGMNTGIQDAFNLGWKLGLVLTGAAGPALLDTYEEERLPVAAWTLDLSTDRWQAVREATRTPGAGVEVVVTPQTSTLGVGYRWSSLAHDAGTTKDGPHAGDRAPDAPCRDAATGARVRLFEVFAGPHFTLLGFGPGTAASLRQVAQASGPAVRTCGIDTGGTGLGELHDAWHHARSAYGVTRDALVLVRPDNHVALTAPPHAARTVLDYLGGLGGQ
jgi:2-polyprenyl-6-methoxyphenol hydroxylase-like FAD-dependent oxidoreductase